MKTLLITLLLSSQLVCHLPLANETNVGNNESYTYKITEIIGNEVHGIAINKISNDNKGIFLYKDELSFNVSEGDNIKVVWGEEEDIFKSIEKY